MGEFIKKFAEQRKLTAESVEDFDFNKKRVRLLSDIEDVNPKSKGILYWMCREHRVQDNWSMLYTQRLSLKTSLPMHVVCFIIKQVSVRHDKFFLRGLKCVAEELAALNIKFHLIKGKPDEILPDFVKENNFGAVVTDFYPLKPFMNWTSTIKKKLPKDVPFAQVDSHNIVPCWVTSDKQEYAARTIRFKITGKLDDYLTDFPPVVKQTLSDDIKLKTVDLDDEIENLEEDSMPEITWAKPGYAAGVAMLESFCKSRIKIFASKRNDPVGDALSNLSPWFRYGHVSPQRCCAEVKSLKQKHTESVNSYLEEAIVRRELSDNFCYYNPNYDSIIGAADWAKKTLKDHKGDKRDYVYTHEEFEKALTHEDLWNSAQLELIKHGKIHGFMRMYWAKKILEWSESPEEALRIALDLNDRFSLDGCDPNGFVGVMWSVCGIHDQGWSERKVFGKIRYMNYNGCKRKFDINAYIARWGGKSHHYVPKKKAKSG